MQLFMDLDGTLFDISEKYYRLYVDCVCSLCGTPMSKKKYWTLKCAKQPTSRILTMSSLSSTLVPDYISRFADSIESEQYTSFDLLFSFAIPTLRLLQQHHELYLVCGRKDPDAAMKCIGNAGLKKYFSKIVAGRKSEEGIVFKRRVIIELIKSDNLWATVGDTEDDINCVSKLSGISVGVLSGLRNKQMLATLSHPSYIIPDIRDLPTLLDKVTKHR